MEGTYSDLSSSDFGYLVVTALQGTPAERHRDYMSHPNIRSEDLANADDNIRTDVRLDSDASKKHSPERHYVLGCDSESKGL